VTNTRQVWDTKYHHLGFVVECGDSIPGQSIQASWIHPSTLFVGPSILFPWDTRLVPIILFPFKQVVDQTTSGLYHSLKNKEWVDLTTIHIGTTYRRQTRRALSSVYWYRSWTSLCQCVCQFHREKHIGLIGVIHIGRLDAQQFDLTVHIGLEFRNNW
jgi:hypothetical protein